MTKSRISVNEYKSWKALEAHYLKIHKIHLRDLFALDFERGKRMTIEIGRAHV